jgi:hypothetical protein
LNCKSRVFQRGPCHQRRLHLVTCTCSVSGGCNSRQLVRDVLWPCEVCPLGVSMQEREEVCALEKKDFPRECQAPCVCSCAPHATSVTFQRPVSGDRTKERVKFGVPRPVTSGLCQVSLSLPTCACATLPTCACATLIELISIQLSCCRVLSCRMPTPPHRHYACACSMQDINFVRLPVCG